MIKKLLNKKNLIIIAICLVLLMIPNVSFADSVPISAYLKETIAGWYLIIKYVCLAIMLIALIVLGIKAAISEIAEEKARFKKLFLNWLIGMFLLMFLENIIYFAISTNDKIVNKCEGWGKTLSGIDAGSNEDELDEITLYESAVSKAYEIKFTSGTIGMIMYLMLVYYTIKFFFVYIKRYINVMILIITGPIVVTIYSFRKILNGKSGRILGRWTKELIYNVFIQTVHAAAYATLIGLTVRLGDSTLSFIGAILTLIMFGVIFKLDSIIRKLFNFIGGKDTVRVRDYSSMVRHPVQTFNDEKDYLGQKLQDIKEIPENISEKLNSGEIQKGLIKFKDNSIYEVRETAAALEGKRVKVSKEAIKKEQEKLNNPNAMQKVFNTVRDVAYGVVGLGITVTEKIAKKTKEQFLKLKETIKKQKSELNQDVEMLKRLKRVLKLYNTKKAVVEKDPKFQSLEEKGQATVIELKETPEEEVAELKESIEQNPDDIVAAVYKIEGLQAFIYPELGSAYMGMSVLTSSIQEEKVINENTKRKEKRRILLPNKTKNTNEINVAQKEEEQEEKIIPIEKARKRYKISRFNHTSIKKISYSLNRRYVINDRYLSTMAEVGQKVVNGDIRVSGRYGDYSGVRKTSIKYTAKMSSHLAKETTANIEFGKYKPGDVTEESYEDTGKIIQFTSVRERKKNADLAVAGYRERVQDTNWAILTATSNDIADIHNQEVQTAVATVTKASPEEIMLQGLSDMGYAVKLNENISLVFGEDAAEVLNFTENPEENSSFFETVSEDEKLQIMTDTAIINTAIKFDKPLEEIDIKSDEVQEEILDNLIEKGIISYNVKSNEEKREEVIYGIKERKESLTSTDREAYIREVVQQELANIITFGVSQKFEALQQPINSEESTNEFEEKFDSEGYNNETNKGTTQNTKKAEAKFEGSNKNSRTKRASEDEVREILKGKGKYSNILNDIAKNAVKVEAETVKNELISQLDSVVEYANEEIEKGKELYQFDFKESLDAKVTQVKEDAKEALKEAVGISSKKGKKDKGGKDEHSSDEMFEFWIYGAVVEEGRYELPIGSRIYDAIKAAGGPTDEADLTAVPFYEFIRNGEVIRIPKRTTEDIEEMLDSCRPVVKDTIQGYMVEHNISNVESLRKLVHKNSIISSLQRKLKDKKITKTQIEQLFEERIKEVKYIRENLNNAKNDMKVVDKNEVDIEETEEVEEERNRQIRGAKNKEEASLDEAIRRLNMTGSINDTQEEKEEEEKNSEMDILLQELNDQREKVLVTSANSRKEEARLRYIDESPENMMNKLLNRV